MSHKIIAAAAFAIVLGPMAAQATVIDGSFSGTLTGGDDTTGVFGPASSDLTGEAISGTFDYVTTLLTPSVSGSQNTLTGTASGALTVTVTINGFSHTFTDNTSSSLFLDSGASQITITSANAPSGGVDEDFSLEADDIFTPFITSTDPSQTFSTSDAFLNSQGQFVIDDAGPTVQANGQFTIESISTTTATTSTPEPASLTVLGIGLAGIAGARGWRRGALRRAAGPRVRRSGRSIIWPIPPGWRACWSGHIAASMNAAAEAIRFR